MRRRSVVVGIFLLLLLAGCVPRASGPDPRDGRWYQWSRDAVNAEFGRFGPHVTGCAMRIATTESNLWPFADNGSHHGIFQLHDGFWGSIVATANRLGRQPNWYDPRQNAGAAAIGFANAGGTFRSNWPGTRPPDCP